MPLLDFCIRSANEPPPLPMPAFRLPGGNGISFNLILQTFLIVSFHCVLFRLEAPSNYLAFFIETFGLFNLLTLPTDALSSNSLGRNLENLRRAGYKDGQILAIMNFNVVASQFVGFVVVNFICANDEIYSWAYYKDLSSNEIGTMLLRVVTSLTAAELLFAAGHSLLHTHPKLAPLHIIHHCCTYPTFTSNMLFHPIDLVLEFGGPTAALFGLHFGVFQDQATFLVTYLIFQLWYAYDHDEFLNTYHLQHHKACDSLYVIYTNVRGDARRNHLRQLMRGSFPGLNWPTTAGSQPNEKEA